MDEMELREIYLQLRKTEYPVYVKILGRKRRGYFRTQSSGLFANRQAYYFYYLVGMRVYARRYEAEEFHYEVTDKVKKRMERDARRERNRQIMKATENQSK